jgi:hypothetical protein
LMFLGVINAFIISSLCSLSSLMAAKQMRGQFYSSP